jgi:hypothetical protein
MRNHRKGDKVRLLAVAHSSVECSLDMHLWLQSRCILRKVSSLDDGHLSPLTPDCRALAGMLNKVGLLPKDNEELVCSYPILFQLEESDFYLGPVRFRFVQTNRQTRLPTE